MQEIKLNGESMNIVEDNIEKLKTIFPDVFTEGKVDFEKLQGVLGNYIETNDERYNFTWAGKQNALRLAQTPSTGTLRPCKEESKNWDTTQNLYIEGDNLEVLKLLQKSYHNKIKMIYIDPPYNTGNDFVYKDDFKDNIDNYKKITGQVDEEGNKISSNSESDGRYHTNWLNMMYPRLRLARNLLSDDGVIFISIDDNEVNNLRKLCDEIFGEDNSISNLIWINNERGRSIDKYISNTNDFMLMYAKSINSLSINQKRESGEHLLKEYNLKDNISYYKKGDPLFNNNSKFNIETRPNLVYSIYINKKTNEKKCIDEKYKNTDNKWVLPQENRLGDDWIKVIPPLRSTNNLIGCWRWGMTKFIEENEQELILELQNNGKYMFFSKNRLTGDNEKISKYKNIIQNITSSSATTEVVNLMSGKFFEHPKPINLIKHIIRIGLNCNDIILDFFSGSATTAHAVMQLNSEDNRNRKFICVQLPEQTDEKSEAFKAGYKNICEIGKERIRRAGEKIKQELEQENQQLKLGEEPKKVPDIGFKVFKLDSSNIKKWNANTENLEKEMQSSIFNYVEDRSELDIVYEVMLKCGLDLTYPIEEIKVEDKTLYSVGAGAMFICMDDRITQSIADKIIAIKEENEIEEPVVVFKDNGFIDDSTKTNMKESLRVAGIKDFITV